MCCCRCCFFFSSRRRHTRWNCEWSSDVCSSDLRPQARSPPVSLPARAPRYPAARRRRRAQPPRAPPHFSSRRARPAAALDSAAAPRRTAPCVHAAEERCPRASAVARPASTAPGPGQGQRLPGTSPAAARPTGATPVRLARARLVEPPAPAQYRQRSVAFDLGHARSPVVRLGAGGGCTREILATARSQRESAGAARKVAPQRNFVVLDGALRPVVARDGARG